MARNPIVEGKYVTVLQSVTTTGGSGGPNAITISAVRQIRRVVSMLHWDSGAADPTFIARASSGTDMLGNIVYIYTTNLAGAGADATGENFWITVEVE